MSNYFKEQVKAIKGRGKSQKGSYQKLHISK